MKLSSLKEEKIIVLIKETNDFDEINNFFMNKYWNKIGIFVKLMRKVSMRWKNWTNFKSLHSIQFRGEKLVEDRDTILELTGKILELQNEIYCKNDSRDFQNVFSTQWSIPRYQSTSVFRTSSSSWWNAKPFYRNAEPQKWAAKYLGHTWKIGKRFLQIQRRLLQHLIRKSLIFVALMYQNTHHNMCWVRAKHQLRISDASQDRQPKTQSSPVREDFQRIMVQTNNDWRFQILLFW